MPAMSDSQAHSKTSHPSSGSPPLEERDRLREQLTAIRRKNDELQERVFAATETHAASLETETLPALCAHVDELIAAQVKETQQASIPPSSFSSSIPASLSSSIPSSSSFSSLFSSVRDSGGVNFHSHAGRELPSGRPRSDAVGAVRVVCRYFDAGGGGVGGEGNGHEVEEEEEDSFFLRLTPELATFQDLKEEILRFWRVPPIQHLRCKLVNRHGAIWPLRAFVHEVFCNLKETPEVYLVVTEPYSFDDVQQLGDQVCSSRPNTITLAEAHALQQLAAHELDSNTEDDPMRKVSDSVNKLRRQATRLHVMMWLFLFVAGACVVQVFVLGGSLRAYTMCQLVSNFLQLDDYFGDVTETARPTESNYNTEITLKLLHEMTLDEVVKYFEGPLKNSVFHDHDIGLGIIVGDMLLQTTRVMPTECKNIGTRASVANSQIQTSMCYPVEYNSNTLSTATYGVGSEFVYVDGGFDVEWGSTPSGFFQPLPIKFTEESDWSQIFVDLRSAGFWDIQTHATTLFCTVYSRSLHAAAAVTVSFTRRASGTFSVHSNHNFFPITGFEPGIQSWQSTLAPYAAVPGLAVTIVAALVTIRLRIAETSPHRERGRRYRVRTVCNPTIVAALVALVLAAASVILLALFLRSANSFSFAIPRNGTTLSVGNPSILNASSLLYDDGAYSSQFWPALLYSMHSYCFALALAAMCLPFAELALLWQFSRQPFQLVSLSAQKLAVPVAMDACLFCTFAASGRLLTGPVILNSGTIVNWLQLVVDCLLHGQALYTVFYSPTSPALVTQMAFVTACIMYVCAITVPMYYAIVNDALVELKASTQSKQRLTVLNFSWRRLLRPWRPFDDEKAEGEVQLPPDISLHTDEDDLVWTDDTGWLTSSKR